MRYLSLLCGCLVDVPSRTLYFFRLRYCQKLTKFLRTRPYSPSMSISNPKQSGTDPSIVCNNPVKQRMHTVRRVSSNSIGNGLMQLRCISGLLLVHALPD